MNTMTTDRIEIAVEFEQKIIRDLAKRHLDTLAANYESARAQYWAMFGEDAIADNATKKTAYEMCLKLNDTYVNAIAAYRALDLPKQIGTHTL